MKKPALLSRLVLLALLSATSPVWAAPGSFTVNNGQTNTTAQTLGATGVGTVNAGGTLNVGGGNVAITVTGSATINNSGTIEQTGTKRAIRDNTGGLTLNVTNSGVITTVVDDTFQMNVAGSSVSLTNTGTISALGSGSNNGQAIDWAALNTNVGTNVLHNNAGGVITAADADAVRPGQNGVITNDGLIKSSTLGDNNDGIDLQNNTNVSISNANANLSTNANLIEGARHGITGGQLTGSSTFTLSVTNNSNGTIKGDDGSGINIDGLDALETVTIVNNGTITGNGSALTGSNTTQDGDGVDVDGVVNITNTGTIKSINSLGDTSEGITTGGGTITNSGTIQGSVTAAGITSGAVGRGITLAGVDKNAGGTSIPIQKTYAPTTITNSGLIKGDTDAGIAILGVNTTVTSTYTAINYAVTITNTAGGHIEGGGSVAVIDGSAAVTLSGTGTASANDETVINYGTIKATGSGKAISLGSGTNSVQIMGGSASVIGDMSGGTSAGSNTLAIDPSAGQSFSYSGVISNFSSVDIKSGTVTFSGANVYNGTTSIEGVLNLTGSGTIGTTTTLTISNTGTFNLGGGTVTVGTLANSGTINNGTVNATTIGGLSGSGFNKTGSDTLVISGSNSYTGGTTVSAGKLAVNGSITGNVDVHSGAELGGRGSIGGTISGAGKVGPGNSPGIMTASSVDPSGGLTFNFEFTLAGAAAWNNAGSSGNDVLHLTAALPFTSAMTSANTINLYFSALSTTYVGGFFTDGPTNNLSSNLANAIFNYYILDNTNGTVTYNGNKYDLINGQVLAGTTQVAGANFSTGTTDGWAQSFYVSPTAIPEPSTYLMIGIGALVLIVLTRKRRLGRD